MSTYDRHADARAYFLAALDNGVHPLVPMTTSRAQAVRDQVAVTKAAREVIAALHGRETTP